MLLSSRKYSLVERLRVPQSEAKASQSVTNTYVESLTFLGLEDIMISLQKYLGAKVFKLWSPYVRR